MSHASQVIEIGVEIFEKMVAGEQLVSFHFHCYRLMQMPHHRTFYSAGISFRRFIWPLLSLFSLSLLPSLLPSAPPAVLSPSIVTSTVNSSRKFEEDKLQGHREHVLDV